MFYGQTNTCALKQAKNQLAQFYLPQTNYLSILNASDLIYSTQTQFLPCDLALYS